MIKVDESQTVLLNGRNVEISGIALELMLTMEKAGRANASAAFERGYRGGLRFALAVCDEHGDVDHIKRRVKANLGTLTYGEDAP